MAHSKPALRSRLSRSLATLFLVGIYCFSILGVSTLIVGASSTSAAVVVADEVAAVAEVAAVVVAVVGATVAEATGTTACGFARIEICALTAQCASAHCVAPVTGRRGLPWQYG